MKKTLLSLSLIVAGTASAQQVTYHFDAKITDKENISFCQSSDNRIRGTLSYNANTRSNQYRPDPFDHFTQAINSNDYSAFENLNNASNQHAFKDESPYSFISLKCGDQEYIWSREDSRGKRYIKITESGLVQFTYGDDYNGAPFEVELEEGMGPQIKQLSLTLQSAIATKTGFDAPWGAEVPAHLTLDKREQSSLLNVEFRDIQTPEGPKDGFIKAKLVSLTTGLPQPISKGINIRWEGPILPTVIDAQGGRFNLDFSIDVQSTEHDFHAPMIHAIEDVAVWSTITLPTGASFPVSETRVESSNGGFHHSKFEIKPEWPAGEYKVEIIVTRLQDGATKTASKTFIKTNQH